MNDSFTYIYIKIVIALLHLDDTQILRTLNKQEVHKIPSSLITIAETLLNKVIAQTIIIFSII